MALFRDQIKCSYQYRHWQICGVIICPVSPHFSSTLQLIQGVSSDDEVLDIGNCCLVGQVVEGGHRTALVPIPVVQRLVVRVQADVEVTAAALSF